MKCTLCNTEEQFKGDGAATQSGWRLTALRGPGGNKYGVFCPNETEDAIAEALTTHLESVCGEPLTVEAGKRKGKK